MRVSFLSAIQCQVLSGIQTQDSVIDRYMDDLIQVILKILDTDPHLHYYQVLCYSTSKKYLYYFITHSLFAT